MTAAIVVTVVVAMTVVTVVTAATVVAAAVTAVVTICDFIPEFHTKALCLEVAARSLLNLVIGGRLGKLQGGCRGKSPWGSLLGKFARKVYWESLLE